MDVQTYTFLASVGCYIFGQQCVCGFTSKECSGSGLYKFSLVCQQVLYPCLLRVLD